MKEPGRSSARWWAAVALIAASSAGAQAPVRMYAPQRIEHPYFSALAGRFSVENNAGKLENNGAEFAAGFNLGYRYSEHSSFEIEVPYWQQDFVTPASVAGPLPATGRSRISSNGLMGTAKVVLPLARLELFAGAGLGLYRSEFFGSGSAAGEFSKLDTGIGYHVVGGADVVLDPYWAIGVETRRVWLDADFGALTPGTVKLGGWFWQMTLRYVIE